MEKNAGSWALVAPGFVFYKIALTRGAEVLVQLLGEVFAGILCSDRCPTYLKYHRRREGQFLLGTLRKTQNILGVLGNRQNNRRGKILPRRSGITRSARSVYAASVLATDRALDMVP